MRRVALIYNPAAGQISARRQASIEQALAVFRAAGVEAESYQTDGPGTGAACAREAVRNHCDAVLACGGDGTVHEILQSLVGTDAALGVIPLGTANALAANLDLVGSPAKIARKLLQAKPVRIPVGRIHYRDHAGQPASRYFIVAAGVGPDALLMSRLDARLKRRLGYVLYLVEAARIWATHRFPLFEAELPIKADLPIATEMDVEAHANGHFASRRLQASQLLAVRVRSFGGALRQLAPGATLLNDNLRLIAFETRSRFSYCKFLLAVLAGRPAFSKEIELLETASVDCRPSNGTADTLYVEADGEVLGTLPVKMEVVPDVLNLLIPPGAQP